ncbi:MAG: 16S rRNA (cytosine(1402)-N(4))-methyltransferase RsmH [Patescibacteria group bacterium]
MHVSVLLKEVVENLSIRSGDNVVDATLGGGGLPKALCEKYGKDINIIGIDADEDAVRRSEEIMKDSDCNYTFKVANFADIKSLLGSLGYEQVERIVFDLGLSSFQLEDSGRGFSFQREEPLKMTFSKDGFPEDLSAYDVVNSWGEDVLKVIISSYGEERFAGRISRGIVESRSEGPIRTTSDLVKIIEDSVPEGYKRRRLHPATKTFQAIRIAVNDEISALENGLVGAFDRLAPAGRMAVISFHGLEDTVTKRFFLAKEKEGFAKRVFKKPIRPSREEVLANPRSRSAKLRLLEKI